MENRICILTLFVFLFLLSGESRAMVAMPDAWTRMMIGVNQKDWSLLRERVQADLHVPDREDVLMLIDYHRDDRMKCENLLRRLNGGEAYRYIMNKILPLLYVYREHSPVPIPDDKAAGMFLSYGECIASSGNRTSSAGGPGRGKNRNTSNNRTENSACTEKQPAIRPGIGTEYRGGNTIEQTLVGQCRV